MNNCVATPSKESTRLLCMLPAAQFPMTMNTITLLQVRYIHTAVFYSSYTLGLRSPEWKFAPPEKYPWSTRPTTPNGIIGIHTELLLLLVMYELLQTYRISM